MVSFSGAAPVLAKIYGSKPYDMGMSLVLCEVDLVWERIGRALGDIGRGESADELLADEQVA